MPPVSGNVPQTSGPGSPFRSAPFYDTAPRISSISPDQSRAGGGGTLTISGANFRYNTDGSAPSVTLGGIAATSVVVVDPNTITCVIPSTTVSGVVDVTVTEGTQSATLLGSFVYVAILLISITPSFGPLAGGTDVILFGYNFILGCSVTFDGTPSAILPVFLDTSHYQARTPNHAVGFVDVVITEP